ncbi:MAG: hypothetical protein ACRC8R_11990 [Aeromonas hydrophila]
MLTFLIWAFAIWQLCRLIYNLPAIIEALTYKYGGEEEREIKTRQDKAIDRRIALMNEQIAERKARHVERLASWPDARPETIRALHRLFKSDIDHARRSCDRDIEAIKKSCWGTID